jgi:hypothetical protein
MSLKLNHGSAIRLFMINTASRMSTRTKVNSLILGQKTYYSLSLAQNVLENSGVFFFREAYFCLVKRIVKALIPFPKIYLYGSGFSTLVIVKTKNRNQLDVQHDIHVALSTQPHSSRFLFNLSNNSSHADIP